MWDTLINEISVEYVFYRAEEQSQISFLTDALPLGVRLSQSTENIVLSYESEPFDESDRLHRLWERGEYEHIRTVCSGDFKGKPKTRKKLNLLRDAMLAICDLETGGDKKKAYAALNSFKSKEADYTSDYTSLVRYYLALKDRDEGDMPGFKDGMWHVMKFNHDCPRIKSDADANRVAYVPAEQRVGHPYTCLLYTSPSPRDATLSRMPSSA